MFIHHHLNNRTENFFTFGTFDIKFFQVRISIKFKKKFSTFALNTIFTNVKENGFKAPKIHVAQNIAEGCTEYIRLVCTSFSNSVEGTTYRNEKHKHLHRIMVLSVQVKKELQRGWFRHQNAVHDFPPTTQPAHKYPATRSKTNALDRGCTNSNPPNHQNTMVLVSSILCSFSLSLTLASDLKSARCAHTGESEGQAFTRLNQEWAQFVNCNILVTSTHKLVALTHTIQ